jgi:hypothetical protein
MATLCFFPKDSFGQVAAPSLVGAKWRKFITKKNPVQ